MIKKILEGKYIECFNCGNPIIVNYKYGNWNLGEMICKKCGFSYQQGRLMSKKIRIIEIMGGKCAICGLKINKSNFMIFCIDKKIPLGKSGKVKGHGHMRSQYGSILSNLNSNQVKHIINEYKNGIVQPLCQNCDAKKSFINMDRSRNNKRKLILEED